jgi:hypothetical protein
MDLNKLVIIYEHLNPYLPFNECINIIKYFKLLYIRINYNSICIYNDDNYNFLQSNYKHFNYLHLYIYGINILNRRKNNFNKTMQPLNLHCTNIKTIPFLKSCKTLKYLDPSYNHIKKLTNINYENNIISLNLSFNGIKEISLTI